MKKTENRVLPSFSHREIRFFRKLNRPGSIFSEYRRLFNITMLIGMTWGLVFLSTVI